MTPEQYLEIFTDSLHTAKDCAVALLSRDLKCGIEDVVDYFSPAMVLTVALTKLEQEQFFTPEQALIARKALVDKLTAHTRSIEA